MKRCVNCGLSYKKENMTKSIFHSEATERYYEVVLCNICHDEDQITVQYGSKRQLSEQEVKRLLIQ